jgi:hypothetical protein
LRGDSRNARLFGDIFEFAVPFVVEELVFTNGREKYIYPAIVVIITDGDSHPIKAHVDP